MLRVEEAKARITFLSPITLIGVIEPRYEREDGRFSTTTSSNQGQSLWRRNGEVERAEDNRTRAWRVSEGDISQLNVASNRWQLPAVGTVGVDRRDSIDDLKHSACCYRALCELRKVWERQSQSPALSIFGLFWIFRE